MLFRLLLVCCFFCVCTNAGAQTTPSLPVTRITLYTSGVGYFERTGSVVDDSSSTLYFPLDQVNDVLKSLVLLDYSGGTIEPVTYGAQDPVTKQLQAFSVNLGDDPGQAALLDRLRGADVTVTVAGTGPAVSGTVVGVQTNTIQLPGQATAQQSSLNLMTADSLVSIPLDNVTAIRIDDPGLRQELKDALATVAQGRDDSKRPVTVQFSGKGSRKVLIGYLTQTPLWQTSYRLVLDKTPYLQGWALVENTSDEDWTNVSLSLVSGRPISFVQDLYSPVYVDRPVVQPQVVGSPTPQMYGSSIEAATNAQKVVIADRQEGIPPEAISSITAGSQDISSPVQQNSIAGTAAAYSYSGPAFGTTPPAAVYGSVSGSSPTYAPAGLSRFTKAAGAQLGTSLFTYFIKVPVTVPRQKSAMIPFVGSDVQAERVSIYNNSVDPDHPLTGARVTDTSGLHLMGGPVTVFDDNGENGTSYVGDALIEDMEPGQTRLLSFAVDLPIDASEDDDGGTQQTLQVAIAKGVLTSKLVTTTVSRYTFKNNSAQDRKIVVEQPFDDDTAKLVEPATYDEKTDSVYRFDLTVPSHDSKELKVVLEDVQDETTQLVDANDDTIAQIITGGGISPDAQSALHQIIQMRRLVADSREAVAANEQQTSDITAGQDRIRKNMMVLDKDTPLYKRYASELDAQETLLANLTSAHNSLENELASRQNALSSYIQNLTIDQEKQ